MKNIFKKLQAAAEMDLPENPKVHPGKQHSMAFDDEKVEEVQKERKLRGSYKISAIKVKKNN
jgi:hypothetical protein